MSKVTIRNALARARLTTPAVLAALFDVFRLDWHIVDDGPAAHPFRIAPGSKLLRYMSGINIMFLEDHARHLVADALVARVSGLPKVVVAALSPYRDGLAPDLDRLSVAKDFVIGRVWHEFQTLGLPGLLALANRFRTPTLLYGHPVDQIINGVGTYTISSDAETVLQPEDPFAKGAVGRVVPPSNTLAQAAAYIRSLSWTVVRGARGGWVVRGGAQFQKYLAGSLAQTPKGLARTLIARAIIRIVPLSTPSITARMRSNVDHEGAAMVQREICERIADVARLQGYGGVSAMAGVSR